MDRLCEQCNSLLKHYQKRYCSRGCYRMGSREVKHPDLKVDYFKSIDTIEKAYWLGFLFADVGISESGNILTMQLSVKDEHHLDRFYMAVGANLQDKKYYGPYYRPDGTLRSGRVAQIYISRPAFVQPLVRRGCVYNKSHLNMQWPDIQEKFDLAFLMGLFDGDGEADSCILSNRSKSFLCEIQDRFKIPYAPFRKTSTVWNINLGADLFRQMIGAYPESMPRKRKTYYDGHVYDSEMRQPTKGNHPRKFDPEPEELERLVWEMPACKVGEQFGVSGRAIKKRCRKYGIETPGRGYWARKRAGKV